jgi:hypothetical protein
MVQTKIWQMTLFQNLILFTNHYGNLREMLEMASFLKCVDLYLTSEWGRFYVGHPVVYYYSEISTSADTKLFSFHLNCIYSSSEAHARMIVTSGVSIIRNSSISHVTVTECMKVKCVSYGGTPIPTVLKSHCVVIKCVQAVFMGEELRLGSV